MFNKPITLLNKPFSPLNGIIVNLVWLNVIVFLVLFIFGLFPGGEICFESLSFDPDKPYLFYTILTNIFLHDGFMHLLGNMIWLYFIGQVLENLIGEKHILRLFIIGGISGTILYAVIASIMGLSNPLVGASGGIAALLVGAAIIAPNYSIFLFGILQIELKWIAIVKILFDLMSILLYSNFGGSVAHFGGYLFGLLYITEIKGIWSFPTFSFLPKNKKPKRSATVNINNSNNPSQAEIDAILDKISANGYDSLTAKEKEKLFSASKK